jgi:hypothetical protein
VKIVNNTCWSTGDIRRLALAVAKFEQVPRERIARKRVTVEYGKYSGHGSINGDWVTVRIPKTDRGWKWVDPGHTKGDCSKLMRARRREFRHSGRLTPETNACPRDSEADGHQHLRKVTTTHAPNPRIFAQTLAHEFAHNAGVDHRAMGGAYCSGKLDMWAWADEYPIRMQSELLSDLVPGRPRNGGAA